MDNIIDLLKNSISPELLAKTASTVGEPESGVSKALGGIFPLILSGLIKKAGDSGSVAGLMNMLKDAPAPETLASNPSDLLGILTGNGNLAGSAGSFLSSILGSKTQEASSFLSNFAGVKSSSAMSLISMAAPLVMSFLGKKIRGGNLNAEGFTTFLMSQKRNIINAAPSGLGNVLGLGNLEGLGANLLNSASSAASQATAQLTPSVEPPKKSLLMPILGLIVLLLAALFMWRSCNTKETQQSVTDAVKQTTQETASAAVSTASTVTSTVTDSVSGAVEGVKSIWADLGEFFKRSLPGGIELNIPKLGVENRLIDFIEDKTKPVDDTTWFTFDRLLFETGSSTLKQESQEQLKNVAEIMKAYPNVEMKLGGYTDNTGNAQANIKLSQERADSVKKELVTMGVPESRLAAEGYGEAHPVASNDTEEGRAKNRRIDLRVTKK